MPNLQKQRSLLVDAPDDANREASKYRAISSVWEGSDAELLEAMFTFYSTIKPEPILDATYNAGRFWKGSTRDVWSMDIDPRYIEVARFLAGLAGASSEFELGSAETFSRPREFDVVLHFGTLYHLPNPLLSLRQSFENLKPGGYLALETQVYDHPQDPNICYFMHMQNNDRTNFWALSTPVLKKNLELIGFIDVREVKKIAMSILAEHMTRIMVVARKPVR